MIDSTTALAFSMYENKGVYALLLGSGISRAAQIPTGWEITLDLTRRVGALEGVADHIDWAAWHQERFGTSPSYSQLLDGLSQTPEERRSILHAYIEPDQDDLEQGRKTPTKAHRAIARLVRDGFVRVLITTNFDRLLETALRELGVEPMVIKSDDDLSGALPLIHTRCFILKVHGDYLDTRLRNTEAELTDYSALQNACLDRIIDDHGLLVCGWSADWDHALRAAITRAPSRRFPLYWASRGTPSQIASDLVAQRAGRIVAIEDADHFFEDLQRKVEVQTALSRPNPLSVELLIATLKRYLPRPEHRIDLADVLTQEVRRARKRLDSAELRSHTQWSNVEFKSRVTTYEAASEALIRVAFTLGRWGDDGELPQAMELVDALSQRPGTDGVVIWLELATYPGLLVFFAYCLGAAKAGRYGALRIMLRRPVQRDRDRSDAAVIAFTPEAWRGGKAQAWQTLEGLERRLFPVSDHLFALYGRLLGEEFIAEDDFEMTFEWMEMLAAIEFTAARFDKQTLQMTMTGPGHQIRHVSSPLGRIGYDSKNQERLLSRLGESSIQAQLSSAKFADGDPEFIEVIASNFRAYMADARWR